VVLLGFGSAQQLLWVVGVALRAEGAADRDRRRPALPALAQPLPQLDRFEVEVGEPGGRVAEPLAPARAGPPGRRVEGEADLVLAGELGKALVVALERLPPMLVLARETIGG